MKGLALLLASAVLALAENRPTTTQADSSIVLGLFMTR